MFRVLCAFMLALYAACGFAADGVRPLPTDQAFVLSAYYNESNQLVAEWKIAPGYYLYRHQVKFSLAPTSEVKIGSITLPQGESKQDSFHGQYQVYAGKLRVSIPLINPKAGLLQVSIDYQGCSKQGFCYSPIQKNLAVNLSAIADHNLTQYIHSAADLAPNKASAEESAIIKLFNKSKISIVLSFLGLGLLLAFTPCVLPMIPILSGIILGHGKKTTASKAFRISLVYVLGMALTYAIVGMVIALIGSSIQAELQKTWVILLFSGVFILLALSLFGFYELQLPSRWQRLITLWSNRQQGGTYIGVFIMGCLSTLLVSPCVSAPLIGVLAYIGQTGDALLGAMALLALGLGMGIPLLLLGMSADKLLPKAGPWMKALERLFGIMMLGVAIWMLSRMIPGPITLFLWSMLCVFSAIYLDVFFRSQSRWRWFSRGIGFCVLIYGVMLMIGAVLGNSDPWYPWEKLSMGSSPKRQASQFIVLQDMQQFDQALVDAKLENKVVMLDFYADWCASCVAMDHAVFAREEVQYALKDMVLLRADVTRNTLFDQALQKRFKVVGPPSLIFFDIRGRELTSRRIVGEVTAKEFLQRVSKIIKS